MMRKCTYYQIHKKSNYYENGLSLIAVLWIITILTVLASEYMYSMQLEVRNSRNWTDQISAFYAAKGGFETALANFRNDETEYDSLDEDWAKGYTGEINNCTFETTITDESSLINVNTADEATIARAIEYCLMNNPSSEDMSDAERTAQSQELARAIIEKRPYRTPAEMAKATGMTPEILYGYTGQTKKRTTTNESNESEEDSNIIALVDITTVYSVDKNVSNDGRKRVNINTADANQIQQGVNPQGQQIITQQEAQAIVDYREQLNNQQNQQGQQQPMQGGQAQQIPNQQGQQGSQGQQQRGFSGIAALLDVPAISQQTFDAIRDRITVSDEDQQGQQGPQGQQQQQRKVNINTASADELRSLSDRIDDGIANSIINYRQNRQFGNIDEIRQVKAISINDLKSIVDRITISDEAVLSGKVNINTVSSELLRILPGMDEQKAEAIIARRKSSTSQSSRSSTSQQNNQEPFNDIGQLLDVEGIDENTFRQIVDYVTYRTSAFRIESKGKTSDEKVTYVCRGIIDRSVNNIEIRYWRQY